MPLLLSILRFPIPLGVLIAAVASGWLWMTFDKVSAVRGAVNKYVAQRELNAAESTAKAWQTLAQSQAEIALEAQERLKAVEEANRKFRLDLLAANMEAENQQDQIDELLSRPVNDACVVDDDLLDRLRNAR